jgi:hypothetical protein
MSPPMHHIIKLPVPKPPPVILSGSHYATKSTEDLCLVTEPYSLLPDHLHCFVPTGHFQSLVCGLKFNVMWSIIADWLLVYNTTAGTTSSRWPLKWDWQVASDGRAYFWFWFFLLWQQVYKVKHNLQNPETAWSIIFKVSTCPFYEARNGPNNVNSFQ